MNFSAILEEYVGKRFILKCPSGKPHLISNFLIVWYRWHWQTWLTCLHCLMISTICLHWRASPGDLLLLLRPVQHTSRMSAVLHSQTRFIFHSNNTFSQVTLLCNDGRCDRRKSNSVLKLEQSLSLGFTLTLLMNFLHFSCNRNKVE